MKNIMLGHCMLQYLFTQPPPKMSLKCLFTTFRSLAHENPLAPPTYPPTICRCSLSHTRSTQSDWLPTALCPGPSPVGSLPTKRPIQDVSKLLGASSTKGGVGKSTITGTSRQFLAVWSSLHPHIFPSVH